MAQSKHRALMISIVLGTAIILRLYPSLFHGAPWGTDGWPLFKDTQQLLASTPTTLGGNSATFADQYNIYWPGVIVYGAISSLILNSIPVQVMPVIIPIVAALSTLFLFVIVERITGSSVAAFFSSLIFTASSFDSIFTASVTKETFAYPLFMAGILLLVLSLKQFSFRNLTLFSLVSLALVMVHYALALIFVAIVISVLITHFIVTFSHFFQPVDYRLALMPLALAAIILSYFLGYALPGFNIPVGVDDVLSISSFLAITLGITIYYALARRKIVAIFPIGLLVTGIALLAASTETNIVPLAPEIPADLSLYALPYIISGLLMIFGYRYLHGSSPDRSQFSFLATWLAVPIALFGYSVFGTLNGLGLIYRLLTFIYAPVAVFAAIALANFLQKGTRSQTFVWLKKTLVIAIIFAIATLSVYQSYASVVQGQDLLGGQWGYTPSDISSAIWTKTSAIQNMNISGDSKIQYLFDQYYGVDVHISRGFEIIFNGITNVSSTPLVTDKIMLQKGYNIQLYGIPLPSDWLNNMVQHSDLIYNNGNDEMWY
ncbi:MAG: hypothetical protein ACYCQJ_02750 [Nitrososphaerales archaeon]